MSKNIVFFPPSLKRIIELATQAAKVRSSKVNYVLDSFSWGFFGAFSLELSLRELQARWLLYRR